MRQSFIFLSQYKSTSMEEKIKRKQVSSSTLIFIHHKDDTGRVFWYILCIILWCRDHFSNWKEVHIVIYSHLDITFGSDWKSPKLLYARRNDSNPYVKEWCFTLVLFLFQKALQYHDFFPLRVKWIYLWMCPLGNTVLLPTLRLCEHVCSLLVCFPDKQK